MSRSGYVDYLEQHELAMYRGRVASAMRGKRGQALLKVCLLALDAMPDKTLISGDLIDSDGCVCTLGAAGQRLQFPGLDQLDAKDHEYLAACFDVAPCLIAEIEYVNDECGPWAGESPAQRFVRVRKWLVNNIAGSAEGRGGS